MRDPEFHWTPDEAARARAVRTRAVSAIVLAASCLIIGVIMGRLTAGIPAGTGSGTRHVVDEPSARGLVERDVDKPSLALKSDTEATELEPPASPSIQAEPKTSPKPVVIINPGAAETKSRTPPEDARARAPTITERSFGRSRQEDRGRLTTDEPGEMRPARDYQSLREHVLGR
jgi:hypothetical protein